MSNYIDSDNLHQLLIDWKHDKKIGKEMNKELGKAFIMITNGVLQKPKYIKLSADEKDDLRSIALLNLVAYIHSYNPDKIKSKNGAFTYITFAAENSIKGELKKRNEKNKRIQVVYDSDLLDSIDIPYLP